MNKEEIIIDNGNLLHYLNDHEYFEYDSLYIETLDYLDRLQKEYKRLQKELDKYKRLVEYLKSLNLYEFDLDYDYDDEPVDNYYPADLEEHIENWFEVEEENE